MSRGYWETEAAERKLQALAGDNEKRRALLAHRREREMSIATSKVCSVCEQSERSKRSKSDICSTCLCALWSGEDALAKAQSGYGFGKGYAVADRSHNFPYPHLPSSHGAGEDNAFMRGDAARTMQALFFEIAEELSKASHIPDGTPVETLLANDPSVQEAGSMFNRSRLEFFASERLATALRDLWLFMLWMGPTYYQIGLNEGTDLLGRLTLGTLTLDAFDKEMNEQRERTTRSLDRVAQRHFGTRS